MDDYAAFLVARAFGWTWEQLQAQPAVVVARWAGYLQAERAAEAEQMSRAARAPHGRVQG